VASLPPSTDDADHANAANNLERLDLVPAAEEGTRIGVDTPASNYASTPSRTSATVPNSETSASQRSLISEVTRSGRRVRSPSRSHHLLGVARFRQ
jgi:hypothetical protein